MNEKKTHHDLTYDLPNVVCQADTKFNSRLHAVAGVPPSLNVFILRLPSPSLRLHGENSVGGKHGGEGCFLHALLPGAEHHVTFVPSGAQGGLAVSFSLGQGDSPKGGESISPFRARGSVFS